MVLATILSLIAGGVAYFACLRVLNYFINIKAYKHAPILLLNSRPPMTTSLIFGFLIFFLVFLLSSKSLNININHDYDKFFIYLLTLLFFFVVLFMVSLTKIGLKFANCPYCNRSVGLKSKWQCQWCNAVQPTITSFYDECKACSRKQEAACCEHCKKELVL